MAFGKTKMLASFALLGFTIGSIVNVLFSWIVAHDVIHVTNIPIADILLAPWFLSGLAGSGLALIAVTVVAYFAPGE